MPRAPLMLLLTCGALMLSGTAQELPDIQTAFAQLNELSSTDRAARQILAAASKDSRARQYVVKRLPEIIDKRETDEAWLNAVRLAGQLKAAEAVPSLQKALSRGLLGGPLNNSFAGQMRLEDDVVAKALSQIGDPAIPAMKNLLGSDDWKARRRAVLVLRNMDSPAARKVLQDRLPHETDPKLKELIENSLRP